ncbi:MAG: leucine-rich repeat domain-containing protein [Clostridia bacterium]|nr:leucine-rich repeat domain-containing protein [Clostridia bacterium]
MKKFFGVVLSIALTSALVLSFVGCADNGSGNNTGDAEVGVIYSIKTDDDGNEYAVADKYALSEADAKKVSNNDYKDILVDLEINEYTDEDGNKYPVKEIAPSAFANQLTIKSVRFGDNVTTIGSACLAGCANLESLTVPFVGNTVDAKNDGKLLGYLFGAASSENSSYITMNYNATGSKSYYIPNALKTVTVTGDVLSDYAFYGMNLSTVNLTGNVQSIGDYAFYGMRYLTTYKIPASVRSIGAYAFSGCNNLTTIDFSEADALTSIGASAFERCELLGYGKDNTVMLPPALSALGAKAFYFCTSLKSVDLSGSAVSALNEYTFYGCEKLVNVRLKAGTNLSLGVFSACDALDRTAIVNIDSATGTDVAFDKND